MRIKVALICGLSASANAIFRASSSEAKWFVKWAIGSGGVPMLGARDLARKLILRFIAESTCTGGLVQKPAHRRSHGMRTPEKLSARALRQFRHASSRAGDLELSAIHVDVGNLLLSIGGN